MPKFFLLLALAWLPLHASKTKQEQMLCEVETLANIFEVSYGCKDYKTDLFNWCPETQLEVARNQILSRKSMTTKEFHQVLLQFCRSTKDYHVSINFCATENALLPITIKEAEKRYFLMDETGKQANYEVTHFNGLPIDCVAQAIRNRHFNYTNEATDQALATSMIRYRHSEMGFPVPKGEVVLTLLKDEQEHTLNLEWDYQPEFVAFSPVPHKKEGHKWSKYECTTPLYYQLKAANLFAAQDSYVPVFGKPIWSAEGGVSNPFSGAIYQLDTGEKIGYLRIPHYMSGEKEAELFYNAVRHLEKNTDALVIDQTGNPGGYLLYTMALFSSLITEPVANISESILLNQFEALSALEDYQMLSGENALLSLKPIACGYCFSQDDIDKMKGYNMHILNEWGNQKFFSDPQVIYGMETINPNPKVRYSKPIVVLVDELCFSCGDLFPALMQDSKRGLIFGRTTAGAGGTVMPYSYPNHMGVNTISVTRSVLYRATGEPLENRGVTPDIEYRVTPDDLMNGYRGYKKALVQAIKQQIAAAALPSS